MASKNRFEVFGEDIHITRDGWEKVATTTYRADYYDELTSVTWTKNGDYLHSSKLNKYLHRYIMEKWYGEDVIALMDANDFVVDHMNNNGFDCRISNLEFLSSDENKAKGMTVDKQAAQFRDKMAMRMFKDFSTGLYQLTLGFNVEIGEYKDGYIYPIRAVKLLYDGDYRELINDARKIFLDFNLYGRIDPNKLSFIDKKIIYAVYLNPYANESESAIIERDGQYYIQLNEHTRIHSVNYDKGWTTESKNNVKQEG